MKIPGQKKSLYGPLLQSFNTKGWSVLVVCGYGGCAWLCVFVSQTIYWGRYGNSSGRGRGGPTIWFENLTAEIWKIQ